MSPSHFIASVVEPAASRELDQISGVCRSMCVDVCKVFRSVVVVVFLVRFVSLLSPDFLSVHDTSLHPESISMFSVDLDASFYYLHLFQCIM